MGSVMNGLHILIPALYMFCFAGLTFVLGQAMRSGAEAYSGEYSVDTARQFEDVFLFIPPRRIIELAWTGAVAFFIIFFLLTASFGSALGIGRGLLFGGLAAILALRAPTWILIFLKKRRIEKFNGQLVEALTNMGNALKAGFSIAQAFESVANEGQNPIAQEFQVLLQQTRIGVKFSDALTHLGERVTSEDLSLMILSIETARQTGGNLTEVFEKIASTIRERMRIERRVRTLTAQQRMQGMVMGFIPLVLGTALCIIEPEKMIPFIKSPLGALVLVAVVILEITGGLVIRKIIDIDV